MNEASRRLARCAAALLLLLAAAACESTPRNLVVLLPEADGHIGQVTVTAGGHSTVLDSAGAATGLDAPNAGPGAVFRLEEDKWDSIFKSAIAAQPTPPVSFTLYFLTDKTRMVRASRALFPEILAEIRRRAAPDVSIIGHTDRTGPETYNEPLSRRRARIILADLVKAGVDPHIIDYSWYGEKNPVVPTPDGVAEPRNRRVEVIVR
jgi:peptidoglycan-associated lipoprotein